MDIKTVFLAAVLCLGSSAQMIQKSTEYGPVSGTEVTFSGRTLHRFLGIPFAKPPTDNLRFLDPQTPDPWTEPLNATSHAPYCMQAPLISPNVSEDCLYLNTYAPENASNLPVMVWIYGGGLLLGGAEMYDPETLASEGVVVVSINYRVSVFGFLSTGDSLAAGNAGLKDQVMALKWVQDNIANFGGDPSMVTIFGESAGAWSVNMHMVSPLSKGLFKRAISQSGSVFSLNIETKQKRGERTTALAKGLGCQDTDTTRKVLECLQGKTTEELLSQELTYLAVLPMIFGDDFLPKHPNSYWDSGDIAEANYMIGFNSEEAAVFTPFLNQTELYDALQNGVNITSPVFTTLAYLSLNVIKAGSIPAPDDPVWKVMRDQYIPDFNDKIKNMRGALDMAADVLFIGPTMSNLRAMKENSQRKAYLYFFDQVIMPTGALPEGHIAELMPMTGAPELNLGVGHGNEMAYAFGLLSKNLPQMPGNIYDLVPEEDRRVGAAMMNAWISFANNGIPQFTASADDSLIAWPEYDTFSQHYLEFKYPMSEDSIKQRILPERVGLYTDVLPVYLNSLEPQSPPSEIEKPAEECEDTPSTIDRDKAETALFILCAALIVLLLMLFLVLSNYCMMKKQVRLLEAENNKPHGAESDAL